MSIEAMKQALKAHKKNERHHTLAETRYWCDQYKLLAEQAIATIAEAEKQDQPHREGYWCANLACKKCYGADFRLKHQPTAQQAPAQEPNQSPYPEYDRGFSNGWDRGNAAAQRQPLTDEEIAVLMRETWGSASIAPQSAPAFARAIEAAHGIGGKA